MIKIAATIPKIFQSQLIDLYFEEYIKVFWSSHLLGFRHSHFCVFVVGTLINVFVNVSLFSWKNLEKVRR